MLQALAFYPAFVIIGTSGFSSLTLSDIVNPTSLAASIGAGLTQLFLTVD
jgi:hypothetical protein